MLEEILKNINSNLERIANSLENKTAVGVDLSNAQDKQVSQIIQAPTDILQNITAQMPIAQPVIQAEPNIIQPTMPQAIPTAPIQNSFTQEQLAVAMSNAVAAGKMNIVQGILQQLGVQALTQINPADYNKVATMLKEAGVEV